MLRGNKVTRGKSCVLLADGLHLTGDDWDLHETGESWCRGSRVLDVVLISKHWSHGVLDWIELSMIPVQKHRWLTSLLKETETDVT